MKDLHAVAAKKEELLESAVAKDARTSELWTELQTARGKTLTAQPCTQVRSGSEASQSQPEPSSRQIAHDSNVPGYKPSAIK
eukprot:758937-Amphidinium_carterae.1